MQLSQYFKLSGGPTSGCHVFMLSARAGYTGDETPIYDRFYAGGFNSIRGFSSAASRPSIRVTGQQIGGDFQLLTTAQYMFPITPDDMLRGVLFVDAGTVEPTISDWSDKIRVAPGFGLRIAIPAMGPAPMRWTSPSRSSSKRATRRRPSASPWGSTTKCLELGS